MSVSPHLKGSQVIEIVQNLPVLHIRPEFTGSLYDPVYPYVALSDITLLSGLIATLCSAIDCGNSLRFTRGENGSWSVVVGHS